MTTTFVKDFDDAIRTAPIFISKLKELIKGDIVDIEAFGDTNPLVKLLDTHCGIDALHVFGGQIRGLALRVQWGEDYRTFTVRYRKASGAETEYEKRMRAIDSALGALYPYLTIQAYLDNRENPNQIRSIGVVRTLDLYNFIRYNESKVLKRVCPEGNEFLYVKFSDIQKMYPEKSKFFFVILIIMKLLIILYR